MDMNWLEIRIAWFFQIGIPYFSEWITSAVWNRGIKLHWCRLWIRKDEFHYSLNYDPMATRYMSQDQRLAYSKELMRRRKIAHDRDMAKYLAEAGSAQP